MRYSLVALNYSSAVAEYFYCY